MSAVFKTKSKEWEDNSLVPSTTTGWRAQYRLAGFEWQEATLDIYPSEIEALRRARSKISVTLGKLSDPADSLARSIRSRIEPMLEVRAVKLQRTVMIVRDRIEPYMEPEPDLDDIDEDIDEDDDLEY